MDSYNNIEDINLSDLVNLSDKNKNKNDKPIEKKVSLIFLHSTNETKLDDFDGNFIDSEDCTDSECENNTDKNTNLKKILKVPKQTPLSKKFKIIKGNPITDLQSLINSLEHSKATKFQKDFVEILKELNGMVGMDKFKEQLINQLLFFIQDYKEPGMFLHTVLTGSPGSGKCLGYNTPVIMFDRKIKMVQDIKTGDKLMGDDGSERNVLSVCKGKEKMFEVQQKNADNYIVNESHILSLILTKQHKIKDIKYKNGEIIDISVKDYNDLPISVKSFLKGYKCGINFNEQIVPKKQSTKINQIKNNLITDINIVQVEENYYDQGEHYNYYYGFEIDGNHRFLLGDHTVTHNTTCCKILGKIYSKLGILQTDKVVIADRSSLIAKYLGHTAIKTKEVLKSAKGGVLLIDEVYSLGNKYGGDSFSKECIDTINQYLSENAEDFICVIAGYKDQVQECFFDQNPGLERRFPWKFIIDDYNEIELCFIFKTQINNGWEIELDNNYIIYNIKNNKELFKGNGGDTKNLVDKCKMAHARRTFTDFDGISNKKRKLDIHNKTINKLDFDAGLKFFIESKGIKKETYNNNHMYI
jgi:hypothetical protein